MPQQSLSAAPPAISTREEFIRLQQQRATPADELNLTPDRSTALTVNSSVERENETRLQFLGARLEAASHDMQRDHALAALEGKAQVDFGLSR